MMRRGKFIYMSGVGLSLLLAACATGKKEEKKDSSRTSASVSGKNQASVEDDFYVSNRFKPYTQSLSNNNLTSETVSASESREVAAKLEEASKGDKVGRKELVGLMSAQRISRKGLAAIMATARKLAALEMQKDSNRDLPEFAKLELALSAIQAKKFNFAEFYLPQLTNSRNKGIKAAAYNAIGLIAAIDGRLPEAETAWAQALKADPENKAARLNLGFYAAKYGDLKQARDRLGPMQGDWFAASGLLVAERLAGNNDKASQLCGRVLQKQRKHQPTLFNCGLHEFQNLKDYGKAKDLLRQSTSVPRPNSTWAEKAMKVMAEVDRARRAGKKK